MKHASRLPRTPCNLSESVHNQLNMYALAATAAGVGMLALAPPAGARIVYTPAHLVIGRNTSRDLDLNHDGIADFSIHNTARTVGNLVVNYIGLRHHGSNGIEGGFRSPDTFLASAVKRGVRISNANRFYSRGEMVAQCAHGTTNSGPPCSSHPTNTLGNWINVMGEPTMAGLGSMFRCRDPTHC